MIVQTCSFTENVWTVVKTIPCGRVLTYQQVAQRLGRPGASRAVGNALGKNRSKLVPCHRVVRSDGLVGGYFWGPEKKIARLKKEGVTIVDGRVVFKK
ncbi:MAG: MGMT family protein [Candidatus Moranbacteria bacterium]|nr:MGMT family protein [Candidatus Moranbacteria bacterium]